MCWTLDLRYSDGARHAFMRWEENVGGIGIRGIIVNYMRWEGRKVEEIGGDSM